MFQKVLLLAVALNCFLVFVVSQTAPPCPTNLTACQLPKCRCSVRTVPGNFARSDTPQIVYLTFDDAITVSNYPFYAEYLDRTNPNKAKISATFFITHEYNDYSLVHQLWRNGHEISLHSITHQTNTQYWSNLDAAAWKAEMVDQRDLMSYLANIAPKSEIKGMRAPFLQLSGDSAYQALSQGGFEWDCSRPTWNQRTPGLWPYTNDYLSTQDCQITPCPTGAFPGFWTVPMIDFIADNGFPCAMLDECNPAPTNSSGLLNLLKRNFLDHYNGNRAPFGVFTHAAYFIGNTTESVQRREGYKQFLDYLGTLNDTYIVSVSQALEWIKAPVKLANITTFAPWALKPQKPEGCAFPRNCRYNFNGAERYMNSCVACPAHFPWLNDPFGNLTSLIN